MRRRGDPSFDEERYDWERAEGCLGWDDDDGAVNAAPWAPDAAPWASSTAVTPYTSLPRTTPRDSRLSGSRATATS